MNTYKMRGDKWIEFDRLFDPENVKTGSEIDAIITEKFGLEPQSASSYTYNIIDEMKFLKFLLKYG